MKRCSPLLIKKKKCVKWKVQNIKLSLVPEETAQVTGQ